MNDAARRERYRYEHRTATQRVQRKEQKGLVKRAERCEKCDAKVTQLSRYFPNLPSDEDVMYLCLMCYRAAMPFAPDRYRNKRNYTPLNYQQVRNLLIDQDMSYAEVAFKLNRNPSWLARAFRKMAIEHGELEQIQAWLKESHTRRTRNGHIRRKYTVQNGVAIYGMVQEYLKNTLLIEVDSEGVATPHPLEDFYWKWTERIGVNGSHLRQYFADPTRPIQRERAAKLLMAIGEPLPEEWPEAKELRQKEYKAKWYQERQGV